EFLRRPERLAMQAVQLGMVPATASQIVDAASIGRRDALLLANSPLAVALPSGGKVELRARPLRPMPTPDRRFEDDIGSIRMASQ
ncbi:MAG: hypothetical protein AAFY56_20020, partial [Pseudomonadota bacterium]